MSDLSANNSGKFAREGSFRDFTETETLEKLSHRKREREILREHVARSTKRKRSTRSGFIKNLSINVIDVKLRRAFYKCHAQDSHTKDLIFRLNSLCGEGNYIVLDYIII